MRRVAPLLLAVIASCSGATDGGSIASAPPSARSLRLLDHLATARIRGDLREFDPDRLGGAVGAARRFDADAMLREPWFDGAWQEALAAGETPGERSSARRSEAAGAAWIAIPPGRHGYHAIFPAAADQTFEVRARLRVGSGVLPTLRIVMHARAAPETDLALGVRQFDEHGLAVATGSLCGGPDAAGFSQLAALVPPRSGRHSISISLLADDDGAIDVAAVEVQPLEFKAAVAARPRFAHDRSASPLARVLEVAGSAADALLLPPGFAVGFPVALPAEGARLTLRAGALDADGARTATIAVDLDGTELAAWERKAAPIGAAQPLDLIEVALPRGVRRMAELRFRSRVAAGDEAAVVPFVVAPRLVVAEPAPRHLVLLSIDTLRADALGSYGNATAATPTLDGLAARGTRFAQVWSPSSYTLPTHASMLSGQHPLLHDTLGAMDRIDPAATTLLAERFRAAGFATAAFTGGGFVAPHYGFAAGFDTYSVDDPQGRTTLRRDARRLSPSMRAATTPPLAPTLEWLRAHAAQSTFLFLHTFFVHNYAPAPAYLARFADPAARHLDDDPIALRNALLAGDAVAAARLRALYAATVAQVDHELVAALLQQLERLGIADSTVVAIVSDHGEEFGEHGNVGHGNELWPESTRVPWLLAGPGVPAQVIEEAVVLDDVAVTLAARFDLPATARTSARDALTEGDGRHPAPLQVLGGRGGGSGTVKESLVAGPWQLLRWRRKDAADQAPRTSLHHLGDDPCAQHDRSRVEAEMLRRLTERLDRQIEGLGALREANGDPGAGEGLSEEQKAILRELGYLDD
ncbi:MAG: sulfatase [Planctomycetes bacterium]|nr:sulfatase [Planctomycetota bacterium]